MTNIADFIIRKHQIKAINIAINRNYLNLS